MATKRKAQRPIQQPEITYFWMLIEMPCVSAFER